MAAVKYQPPADVLQLFWDLSELDLDVRVKAAQTLVSRVRSDQQDWSTGRTTIDNESLDESATRQQGVDYALRRCCPLLVYCIQRLVKGLASGRNAARLGFATAFAEVLQVTKAVDAASLPLLLEGLLETTRTMKGADAKDNLMGRIFGYGALARAGLSVDSNAAVALVQALLKDCGQRSYLREAGTVVLLDMLSGWSDTLVAHVCEESAALREMLTAEPEDATPEALLAALRLWPRLGKGVRERCKLLPTGAAPPPATFFQDPGAVPRSQVSAAASAVFSSEYLSTIAPVLLKSSAAHPRLHSVWGYLLALLLPGFKPVRDVTENDDAEQAEGEADSDDDDDDKKPSAKRNDTATKKLGPMPRDTPMASHLDSFWTLVVEQGLFTSSHERKYLGFSLFLRILPYLRPQHVQSVFSKNFLHSLVTNLTGKQPYLHNSAKRCVDRMVSHVDREGMDSSMKLAVAVALQRQGGIGFDQLTRTKTTTRMLQGLDGEAVYLYIEDLKQAFIQGVVAEKPGAPQQSPKRQKLADGTSRPTAGSADRDAADEEEDESEEAADKVDARRRQTLELLCAAARFPRASTDNRLSVLRFLSMHAFFQISHPAKAAKSKVKEVLQAGTCTVPLLAPLRAVCASRILTLLSSMQHSHPPKKPGKGDKQAVMLDAAPDAEADVAKVEYLLDVVSFIRKLDKSPATSRASPLPEPLQTALDTLIRIDAALTSSLSRPIDTADQAALLAQKRGRCLLRLVQLLQLYVLGGMPSFDPGVALDFQRAAVEAGLVPDGETLQLDPPAAAAAQSSLAGNVGGKKVSKTGAPAGDGNKDTLPARGRNGDENDDSSEEGDEEDMDDADEDGVDARAALHWMDVLVDTLLSLMAQPGGNLPSAPLREAAEAMFRACCAELTQTGLKDLLRVVSGTGQAGPEGEDDDIYEEEEEEEVEMGEEGDGSEEEEVESQNGEEEEEDVGMPGPVPKQKAVGTDSESDEEDFDDDQMFKMEGKMAAYMRAVVEQRQSAHQRVEALHNLQFRALACLEAFIKKAPQSPLLLLCVVPLLRALARASGSPRPEISPLAKRLAQLLGSRLAKCRPVFSSEVLTPEELQEVLKRTLYYASREKSKPVSGAAGGLLVMVLRAAAAGGLEAPVVSVFTTALKDLCHKKKTRLGVNVLCGAAREVECIGREALGVIAEECCKAGTPYRQVEALQVLSSAFNGPKDRYAALASAVKAAHGALRAALVHAVEGPFGKKTWHTQAVKYAKMIVDGVKRVGGGQRLAELLGPPTVTNLAKAVVNVKAIPVPQSVANAIKRLADAADLQPLLEGLEPVASRVAQLKKLHEKAATKHEVTQDAPVDKADGNFKKAKGKSEDKVRAAKVKSPEPTPTKAGKQELEAGDRVGKSVNGKSPSKSKDKSKRRAVAEVEAGAENGTVRKKGSLQKRRKDGQ